MYVWYALGRDRSFLLDIYWGGKKDELKASERKRLRDIEKRKVKKRIWEKKMRLECKRGVLH